MSGRKIEKNLFENTVWQVIALTTQKITNKLIKKISIEDFELECVKHAEIMSKYLERYNCNKIYKIQKYDQLEMIYFD